MNKFSLVFLVMVLLADCREKYKNNPGETNSKELSAKDKIDPNYLENLRKLKIRWEMPTKIDSAGYLIFPLRANLMMEGNVGSDPVSLYRKKSDFEPLWNLIFYDPVTRKHHLLSDKSELLIMDFQYQFMLPPQVKEEKVSGTIRPHPYLQKYIVYLMKTEDYNLDNKINLLDPTYLFVSDRMGKNLQQITPSGQDVMEWAIIDENTLIIKSLRDENKDRLFDEKDKDEVFYHLDLHTMKQPKVIFNQFYRMKLKTQYLNREKK